MREQLRAELPWHRYTASWQPDPEGPAETFYAEDGPGWNDVEQAVAWGRTRAPIVYVRLGEGLRDWYNAGEKDDHEREPTSRWRGSRRRRARGVHPDYGGVVFINEEGPDLTPTGEFLARWEDGDDDDEAVFTDVEAAIDWGRERATVVLVAELPSAWVGRVPTYEIRSAGEEDPDGDPMERIRPRGGQETLEWMFETRHTIVDRDPREFGEQLKAALGNDETVWDVRCEVRKEEPQLWTFASTVAEDAGGEPPTPQRIHGWVDVSFRVSAPLRNRAFEAGLTAFRRALATAGEASSGYFVGHSDVRPIK